MLLYDVMVLDDELLMLELDLPIIMKGMIGHTPARENL
jgi:hypothetical protein